MIAIIIILWTGYHWQFTFFYLELAALFRLTFESHNDADFERVRARKKLLWHIQVGGCITLLLLLAAFILFAELGDST